MIELKNVTFNYKNNGHKHGVFDINLKVAKGDCIVLTGASGSGKTTLTRLINGLIPHYYQGDLQGDLVIAKKKINDQKVDVTARTVGSVFQNPKTQFFNVDTTSELAFGLENQGVQPNVIRRRLDKVVNDLSLESLIDRSIFELSGGQKQKIACGSVIATNPEVIVLDEPSSNLDKLSIEELKQILLKLKSRGVTLIISEHRLHYLTALADRFYVMDQGRITQAFTRHEFLSLSHKKFAKLGLRTRDLSHLKTEQEMSISKTPYMRIDNMSINRGQFKLNVEKCMLYKHEVVGVIGHNGAGKSTFMKGICGLIKTKERVYVGDKIVGRKKRIKRASIVMQDVNSQLFTESIEEEVSLGSIATKVKRHLIPNKLNLDHVKSYHPHALSGGQKQRVAIASALLSTKEILMFDEPTSGLDYPNMICFSDMIHEVKSKVSSIMIITHDIELLLKTCDRILLLDNGRVADEYMLDESGIRRLLDTFMEEEKKCHKEII